MNLRKWKTIIGKELTVPKKTSVEMQLVDIEEQLETLTEKINKLGSCYDNYMENQTELNVNIYMLLEKLI